MADNEGTPALPSTPSVYFNGFQLGLSNADINLVLALTNVPAVSLHMSYTTAKTLSLALTDMITTLERVTERKIMTNAEVAKGIATITGIPEADGGNVH